MTTLKSSPYGKMLNMESQYTYSLRKQTNKKKPHTWEEKKPYSERLEQKY